MNTLTELSRLDGNRPRPERPAKSAPLPPEARTTDADEATCAAIPASCGRAERLGGDEKVLHQMTSLLRPWTTVKAIQDAPQPILDDLLARERQLEERITGHSTTGSWIQPLLATLVVVGCTSGAALALMMSSFDLTGPRSLRFAFQQFVHRIFEAAPGDGLMLVAVLPWLIGTFLLWTACRR